MSETKKTSISYYIFILTLYFFVLRDYLERVVPIFRYADELIAIAAVPIWLIQLKTKEWHINFKKDGYGRFILLFAVLSLVSSIVYMYQSFFKCALPDLFLCFKFWLAIYVGKYIFGKLKIEEYACRIFFHVKIIILFFLLLLVFDYVFNLFPGQMRYGLKSVQLFYVHPTVLVAECSFLLAIMMMLYKYVNVKPYVALTSLIICLSLRSKAFAVVLVFVVIFLWISKLKRPIKLSLIIMLIPIIIFLGWNMIYFYYFGPLQAGSARAQLTIKSIQIANDHFPLGAGSGTFATYYSSVEYSPLYIMYSLEDIDGLREGATHFVSDTFWPAILGQAGWLGLIFYILAVCFLYLNIQKLRKFSYPFYATGLFILAFELIDTLASAAFFNPLSIQFAIILGYIFRRYEDAQKTAEKT